MEIIKGFEAIGKALWFRKERILVIADLHIGYEFMLKERGIQIPFYFYKKIKQEVSEIIEKVTEKGRMGKKGEKIIILGDLKHEFGRINKEEWFEVLDFLDFLKEKCKGAEIILIKGNHDTILGPLAKIKGLEIKDFYCVKDAYKDVCFLHGDKIINNKEIENSKILILGHEHPCLKLREGSKIERFKCFLLGKYKHKKIIVLPSFFTFEGFSILEKNLSPYLISKRDFEAFVMGENNKIYKFGKIRNIKNFAGLAEW